MGIYFLSFIPLIKNKIFTSFLHLPKKYVYNIISIKKKSNEKIILYFDLLYFE